MDTALDLRHLRLLEAVALEGSMTRAGRRLHVTQSALSHQLREAEERLGAKLFLRVKKKLILTPAGREMLSAAERVLADLRRAEGRARGLAGGSEGPIRLSTECYTGYHWLPGVLKAFHRSFPGVEVRIDVDATPRAVDALLDGKLDLAIVFSEPKDPHLRLTPLFEDEVVLVLAPGHRLAERSHVHPRDLADEVVLVYPPREESSLVRRVLRPAGVDPRRVMEVPLTEAILELARAGVGVGFLARWALGRPPAGSLVTRPLSSGGLKRRWQAATLRAEPMSPALTHFVRLVAERGPAALESRRRAG
jgi:LysR family transcriptional regulator for metE and metH